MLKLNLTDYNRNRPMYATLRQSRSAYPEHSQDFNELMHVTEGTGQHILNGSIFDFAAGQTWFIGSSDYHAIRPTRSGLTWINVAFSERSWQAFLEMTAIGPPPTLSEGRSRAPFDSAIVAHHVDNTQWALAAFLIEALAPGEEPAKGPSWLIRAIASLENPEALREGLPALLDAACVSPSHLSRSVRAAHGMSPTDLILKLRLERAAILLTSTTESIHGIALECGFESLSYFFRSFRHHFKMTPKRYRNDSDTMPG